MEDRRVAKGYFGRPQEPDGDKGNPDDRDCGPDRRQEETKPAPGH